MPPPAPIDAGDRTFVRVVDIAMAGAVRVSGPWLACRPGCTECCMGPFAITQLDARRLRLGLAELETRDPERGQRVRARAQASIGGLADDEPCPALDPETGLCDLYAARPITCRTFGPPARCESGDLAVCELCFQGATEAEIAACEVEIDPDDLEPALLEQLEQETGARGETTVAEALGAC